MQGRRFEFLRLSCENIIELLDRHWRKLRADIFPIRRVIDRFGAIKYCRYDLLPKLIQNKSVSLLSKKERGNDNHVKRSSPVDQRRGREA